MKCPDELQSTSASDHQQPLNTDLGGDIARNQSGTHVHSLALIHIEALQDIIHVTALARSQQAVAAAHLVDGIY